MGETFKFERLDCTTIDKNIFSQLVDVENNSAGVPYSRNELKEIVEWKNNDTFVCYIDEEIVGFLTMNRDSKKFDGCIYLVNIAVTEDHQRRGIAKRLMFEAFNHYNKTNEPTRTIGLHVSESNDKAKNLYKNVGFTLKEFEKDDDGSVSMAMTTTLEVWGQGIHKVLGI